MKYSSTIASSRLDSTRKCCYRHLAVRFPIQKRGQMANVAAKPRLYSKNTLARTKPVTKPETTGVRSKQPANNVWKKGDHRLLRVAPIYGYVCVSHLRVGRACTGGNSISRVVCCMLCALWCVLCAVRSVVAVWEAGERESDLRKVKERRWKLPFAASWTPSNVSGRVARTSLYDTTSKGNWPAMDRRNDTWETKNTESEDDAAAYANDGEQASAILQDVLHTINKYIVLVVKRLVKRRQRQLATLELYKSQNRQLAKYVS